MCLNGDEYGARAFAGIYNCDPTLKSQHQPKSTQKLLLPTIPKSWPFMSGPFELEQYDETAHRWILQRGAACSRCRSKKQKCDAQRPVCGRCNRVGAGADCVYDSTPRHSRLQALRRRLRDLENQIQASAMPSLDIPARMVKLLVNEPIPPRAPLLSLDRNPALLECWWEEDEIPLPMKQCLLALFIQHRRPMGLEFNVSRLREQAFLPSDHSSALHPAFLNAIYMLACHFDPEHLSIYELAFLKRTLKSLHKALETVDRLLDFVRASVLTGLFYYYKGRWPEGHLHTSAAARFAIGCGLHKITPQNPSVSGLLNPPKDSIELGDRIHTFWFLFIVDRGGSLWSGFPPSLTDEEIETAWPRPTEDYEKGDIWGGKYASIHCFLTDDPRTICQPSDTIFCQRVKGVVLIERAARFMKQSTHGKHRSS
ncbi:hypothetical protein BOTBODRAFT_266526 [Botryobasidium botryosum FD-172 SS1]|uniref:Zn(2)-C6 fungal-type domain-containing protein n=1 Tax=Botryobasidium botryosum (strain FD-172 SS1) TaxID=930990 RepID=A0A067MWW7_BOTB1|nr:hypothetical protein BOTBODRAFT_266526 [Botryobasidium botryosum FD-172 SS1]